MLAKKLFIVTIMAALILSACSKEEPVQDKSATESKPPPISIAQLAKDKLPACVSACNQRVKSCNEGCVYTCRQKCAHKDCNFIDQDKKAQCVKGCYSNCNADGRCREYCSSEQRSCINLCPQVDDSLKNRKE